MKRLKPSSNSHQWPRHTVQAVETRKRDLVIRIADWTRQKESAAYDVECYIGGVYDFDESRTFSIDKTTTKQQAKAKAIAFAQAQIAKLL